MIKIWHFLVLLFSNIWAFVFIMLGFLILNIWAIIVLPLPTSRRKKSQIFLTLAPIVCKIIVYLGFLSKTKLVDRREIPLLKQYKNKGVLFIANHSSLIDTPLMNMTHPFTTLMKREIIYIPMMTLPSIAANQITVKRGDPIDRKRALKQSLNNLYNNGYLLYYPEGTRSKTDSPKPFENIHLPILRAAYKKNIPIVPISLFGTKTILTKRGFIKPFQKMGMITHNFLLGEHFSDEEEFLRACWEKVVSGHQELKDELS